MALFLLDASDLLDVRVPFFCCYNGTTWADKMTGTDEIIQECGYSWCEIEVTGVL